MSKSQIFKMGKTITAAVSRIAVLALVFSLTACSSGMSGLPADDNDRPKPISSVSTDTVNGAQTSSISVDTDAQSTVDSFVANSTQTEDEVLTVENNSDMATLFSDSGATSEAFVSKYSGKTIEFDGCIAYMSFSGDYTTRYDILIYAWDYDENTAHGSPSMQFYNVNLISDMRWTGDVPDTVSEGINLHIVANVVEYTSGGLILLEPVSVAVR